MDQRRRKTTQATRKEPPPLVAAIRGNRQMFPVPTAIPAMARSIPHRELKTTDRLATTSPPLRRVHGMIISSRSYGPSREGLPREGSCPPCGGAPARFAGTSRLKGDSVRQPRNYPTDSVDPFRSLPRFLPWHFQGHPVRCMTRRDSRPPWKIPGVIRGGAFRLVRSNWDPRSGPSCNRAPGAWPKYGGSPERNRGTGKRKPIGEEPKGLKQNPGTRVELVWKWNG